MAYKFLFAVLLSVLFIACNNSSQTQPVSEHDKTGNATIIVKENMMKEGVPETYFVKSINYFLVDDKDTSTFSCGLSETKNAERVLMGFREKGAIKMTYRQRMYQLKLILAEAAKDFHLDSLKSIFVGQLIETGDLAIDITNQFYQKFGAKASLPDYHVVSAFLITSKLGTDLNSLLNPYHLRVENISIEKLSYTKRAYLYLASLTETDSTRAPEKILDCTVWVMLKNTSTQ